MKKKISKKILSFCVALAFLVGSAPLASAAVVSPDSLDHAHSFGTPVHISTREEDLGTHEYISGTDNYGNSIYSYDCRLTNIYWTYDYQCLYCDVLYGKPWEKFSGTRHSIIHR